VDRFFEMIKQIK